MCFKGLHCIQHSNALIATPMLLSPIPSCVCLRCEPGLGLLSPSQAWCRLIRVEQAILEGQGCVVRLAGLYHAQVRIRGIF